MILIDYRPVFALADYAVAGYLLIEVMRACARNLISGRMLVVGGVLLVEPGGEFLGPGAGDAGEGGEVCRGGGAEVR